VAISLMLLSGAGLMLRSFARLGAVDAGFDPHHVLTMRVVLTGSPHAATPETRNQFYRQVLDQVAAVPGVESVSGINHLPLAGDLWTFSFLVEGRPFRRRAMFRAPCFAWFSQATSAPFAFRSYAAAISTRTTMPPLRPWC